MYITQFIKLIQFSVPAPKGLIVKNQWLIVQETPSENGICNGFTHYLIDDLGVNRMAVKSSIYWAA